MGPRSAVLGGGTHADGSSVGLPAGPRNAVLGGGTHADCSTGTFGGAPYGATKRCTGWGRIRT
eukprot:2703059-Pyramimonas_sp.AAC.1